jgi:hypothetical protein
VCTALLRVETRLRLGLADAVVVAAAEEASIDTLRIRRTFGGRTADVSALSATAVGWFVVTVRRRRGPVEVSFAVVLDFVRRAKLESAALDECRGFRGWFVEGTCASGASLVVRRGIASEHYAFATGHAMTRFAERIRLFQNVERDGLPNSARRTEGMREPRMLSQLWPPHWTSSLILPSPLVQTPP